MKKQLAVILVALSLFSGNGWALTLNEARSQGRVGETLNGYLVALQTDAETQALVSEIIKHAAPAISNWLRAITFLQMKWRKWPDKSWSLGLNQGSTSRASMVSG